MSKQRNDDISESLKTSAIACTSKKKNKIIMPLLWFSGSLVINFPLYPIRRHGPNKHTFFKKFKDQKKKKKVLPEVFLQLIPKG